MIKLNKLTTKNTLELVLVILGVLILYLFLDRFALGGPLSSDVTGYMNVSINNLADATIVNRYFHVFIQAIFHKLAPSPLVGLQHYWAFLIALTCCLIYLSARRFTKHSQVLHGLLGVALFLSITDIADTAGNPLVDIPAMLMVALFALVFLLSARREHRSLVLVILLGFIFYLSFRTKETTLPMGILLFGLGMELDKPFNWKLFAKRLLYVLMGLLIGMVFFILLNTIFLNDPLFGFRLSDIRIFLSTYVKGAATAQKLPNTLNWYSSYFFVSLLVPFTLYLISALKTSREEETYPGTRLVWLLPLALIVFPTITIGNQWSYLPRFIFPTLPIICFLAPQFLNLDLASASGLKERRQAVLVFVIGLLLIPIIRIALRSTMPMIGWDIGLFLAVIFIPIMFSIILALVIYYRKLTLSTSSLTLVLILAIITIPIANNLKQMVLQHPNLFHSQNLFYPFSAFPREIQYSKDMRMYVSTQIWSAMGLSQFAKDRNEISALFNDYYDVGSTKNNFVIDKPQDEIPAELLSTNYTYALLSPGDWKTITQDPTIAAAMEKKYQVFLEDRNLAVLLEHR